MRLMNQICINRIENNKVQWVITIEKPLHFVCSAFVVIKINEY